jgi:hypothetical protein
MPDGRPKVRQIAGEKSEKSGPPVSRAAKRRVGRAAERQRSEAGAKPQANRTPCEKPIAGEQRLAGGVEILFH